MKYILKIILFTFIYSLIISMVVGVVAGDLIEESQDLTVGLLVWVLSAVLGYLSVRARQPKDTEEKEDSKS